MTDRDLFAARRAIDLGLIALLPQGQLGHLAPANLRATGDALAEAERISGYMRGRWREVCTAARRLFVELDSPAVRFS